MHRNTEIFGELTDLQPSQRPTLIHSLLFSLRWCARMVSGAMKRLTNSCKQHRNVFNTYEEVNKRLQAPQGGPQRHDPGPITHSKMTPLQRSVQDVVGPLAPQNNS